MLLSESFAVTVAEEIENFRNFVKESSYYEKLKWFLTYIFIKRNLDDPDQVDQDQDLPKKPPKKVKSLRQPPRTKEDRIKMVSLISLIWKFTNNVSSKQIRSYAGTLIKNGITLQEFIVIFQTLVANQNIQIHTVFKVYL